MPPHRSNRNNPSLLRRGHKTNSTIEGKFVTISPTPFSDNEICNASHVELSIHACHLITVMQRPSLQKQEAHDLCLL